jgi:hypothetical protein
MIMYAFFANGMVLYCTQKYITHPYYKKTPEENGNKQTRTQRSSWASLHRPLLPPNVPLTGDSTVRRSPTPMKSTSHHRSIAPNLGQSRKSQHRRTASPTYWKRWTDISAKTSAMSREAKAGTTNIDHVEEGSPVQNSAFTTTGADEPKKGRSHPNANRKDQNRPHKLTRGKIAAPTMEEQDPRHHAVVAAGGKGEDVHMEPSHHGPS